MERQAIKSQITETIKKSQRQLESMIYGQSSKRQRVEIDSALFQANPVMSMLQSGNRKGSQFRMRPMPRMLAPTTSAQ